MSAFYRQLVAVFALAVAQAGVAPAQDDAKPDAAKSDAAEPVTVAKPTRAELRDKQLDVSLEARDIERVLSKLKRASDLAKERITEAAKTAESASTSLEKGDSKAARAEAQQTAEMFKEIAKQLEALLKEEVPQQIAEARQLAQRLAKAEREFAEKFPGMLNPVQANGTGKVDPRSQVRPMSDPDMKRKGSQAQNGGGGKSGEKKEGDKNSEKKDSDGKTAEKKPGEGSGKDPKDKPTGAGAGENKDEPKPGDEPKAEEGGAGQNKKDEPKSDENADGSGGDKPDDKRRDGGGGGSNADRRAERDGNGIARMTAEQRREMVANRAEKLAESGKTLQDVLNAIAQSTEPGDKEAVAKIQEVIKEIDINKLVGEMGQVANMIRSSKDDDAKLSSLDTAERLEIMAQRLDAAYRVIVAPQAEELRKIEQALADLREQLEKLETPSQVAAWHREVRDLLDQLDKLGVSPKDREFLEKEMEKAGFGLDVDRTRRAVNWGLVNGYYAYPVNYLHALIHLQEDVQERIQTLILGDLGNISDDATPPKYQELVERYYEVLSRQGGKAGPAGKPEMRKPKSETGPAKKSN